MTRPLRRLWLRWRRTRGAEPAGRRAARPEPDAADCGTTLGLEISVTPQPPRAAAGRSALRATRS